MSEFNLSEERAKLFNPIFLPLNGYDKKTLKEIEKIIKMQDKEFIRRLKEGFIETFHSSPEQFKDSKTFNLIDKLAGEKLI